MRWPMSRGPSSSLPARAAERPGDHLPDREPGGARARRALAHPGRDIHEQAAGEMRNRLERPDLLGPVARDLWVGPSPAPCAKFLRLFPDAIERTKSFVIYDTTDQKAVVPRALRALDLDDRR